MSGGMENERKKRRGRKEEGGRRREGRWNLALEMLPTGYLGTDLRTP